MEVKIEGQESIQKKEGSGKRESKSRGHSKKIKFGEDSLQTIKEQESKQNLGEEKAERHDKGKYKTVMQIHPPTEEEFSQKERLEKEKQRAKKSSRSLNRRAQKQNTMLVPTNYHPSDDIRKTDGAVFSPSIRKMQNDDAGGSITSMVRSQKTQKQLIEK